MSVFQIRNDDAGKTAFFTAGFILMVILAAAFLASCAKVDAVEQNENAPILIDDPVSLPAVEPIVVNDEATPNSVANEATNQVDASEQPR